MKRKIKGVIIIGFSVFSISGCVATRGNPLTDCLITEEPISRVVSDSNRFLREKYNYQKEIVLIKLEHEGRDLHYRTEGNEEAVECKSVVKYSDGSTTKGSILKVAHKDNSISFEFHPNEEVAKEREVEKQSRIKENNEHINKMQKEFESALMADYPYKAIAICYNKYNDVIVSPEMCSPSFSGNGMGPDNMFKKNPIPLTYDIYLKEKFRIKMINFSNDYRLKLNLQVIDRKENKVLFDQSVGAQDVIKVEN